jgi:hypothetical protein
MPTNLHRYYGAGYLHFITTSCYRRRALLGTPQSRDLFLQVMERVRRHRNPVVRGLVLAPEQWNWSSYRHYAFGERGPVLVNEAQKAEMRVLGIA